MSGICEIIIAGLGVMVACLQIRLSKQINEQTISRERDILLLKQQISEAKRIQIIKDVRVYLI